MTLNKIYICRSGPLRPARPSLTEGLSWVRYIPHSTPYGDHFVCSSGLRCSSRTLETVDFFESCRLLIPRLLAKAFKLQRKLPRHSLHRTFIQAHLIIGAYHTRRQRADADRRYSATVYHISHRQRPLSKSGFTKKITSTSEDWFGHSLFITPSHQHNPLTTWSAERTDLPVRCFPRTAVKTGCQ